MINDLSYAVTFPTNGVSLNGHYSFQPGATAITGDNGTGKSFVAEMIRYGLFGKKALRGPASDYKSLDMTLMFEVGETTYFVVRAKKEQLEANGEILAVGADAVNKKILEILGFGLEVFDVVCAANQKESERLTKLTPAKRKELIDEVVGLTRQEAVEKACKEEAKTARIEAEALTRALVLPVEPVKPHAYKAHSDKIKERLEETKVLIAQREKLQRIIDGVPPTPPKPFLPRPDIAVLEAHEKLRVQRNAERASIERQLSKLPKPQFTSQQLDEAEALAEFDALVARRGPRPDYSEAELVEWERIWQQKKLLDHEMATCPECQHYFVLDAPDVDATAIAALPTPPIPATAVFGQLRRCEFWRDELTEPKGTRLSAVEISTGRMALALAGEKPRLEQELAACTLLEDQSAMLADARRLDREWDLYDAKFEDHCNAVIAAEAAQTELEKLSVPKATVDELQAIYTASVVYERELKTYAENKARFDALSAEIAAKQERADAFTAGARGLVEARRTLKAFLAPSLSRVANKLIQQMTENSLRPIETIYVDEDMNITADGQDVSTFNGAHATMINLALRLALGQVLVARVLPLFIGDEIDSDATPANAQAIADGLMACKDQLKQIVLISHKRLEGVDYEITL